MARENLAVLTQQNDGIDVAAYDDLRKELLEISRLDRHHIDAFETAVRRRIARSGHLKEDGLVQAPAQDATDKQSIGLRFSVAKNLKIGAVGQVEVVRNRKDIAASEGASFPIDDPDVLYLSPSVGDAFELRMDARFVRANVIIGHAAGDQLDFARDELVRFEDVDRMFAHDVG